MKTNYYLITLLLVFFSWSCSDDIKEDLATDKVTVENEIYIRNTDRSVVTEISSELYNLILSDLEKEGNSTKCQALRDKYFLDNETQNYILKNEYSLKLSNTTKATSNYLHYRAHLHIRGWQNYVNLGYTAGTVGEKTAMEAFELTSNVYIPNLRAQAHVQGTGWLSEVGFGQTIGTTNQKRNLEAFRINIPSTFATNVYYRAHVSYIGWQNYVSNNMIAGTTGQAKSIEAIQIHMFIL